MSQVKKMLPATGASSYQDAVFEHVCIRPLRTDDVALLSSFFRSLSDETRYRRFMCPVREVSDGLVLQLASADQQAHVAVAATIADEAGEEAIVAEARYVPCGSNPELSEFALAIRDDWQGLGLGRRLLLLLEQRACAEGFKMLIGETLPHNKNMIKLGQALGYRVVRHAQDFKLMALQKDLSARMPS